MSNLKSKQAAATGLAPVLAGGAFILAPSSGEAQTITNVFQFDGVWQNSNLPDAAPGTIGSLLVDFNYSATDLALGSDVFFANNAINSAVLTFGNGQTLNFGSGSLTLLNNFGGAGDEFFFNFSPTDMSGGLGVAGMPNFTGAQFLLRDTSGSLFSSDNFSSELRSLHGQNGIFDLAAVNGEAHAMFHVQAVPEPGGISLVLLGMASLAAYKRWIKKDGPGAGPSAPEM